MNIINVYEPEYVRRFQCNGNGCLCTCCIGKQIPLDKVNSHCYLKSSDKIIRAKSQQNIHLKRIDHENWGVIIPDNDNYCPFFDKQRSQNFCLLNGRSDLHTRPKFCIDYPFVSIRWQNEMRKSLAIECPEACSQILMNQSSAWLESKKKIVPRSNSPLNIIYQLVNSECLAIAFRPQLTASEKLYGIGQIIFSLHNEAYSDEKNRETLGKHIKSQAIRLSNDAIKQSVARLPRDYVSEWQLFSQISNHIAPLASSETTPGMRLFWKKLQQDIAEQSLQSGAEKITSLNNTWKDELNPMLNEFSHVATNYLFYRLYHDGFPFHPEINSDECYYHLIVDCFMLRNLVSYWAQLYNPIRKNKLIEIVNVYHRWQHQYSDSLMQNAESLKRCGLNSREKITQLLLKYNA